jgi:hypothetical protein
MPAGGARTKSATGTGGGGGGGAASSAKNTREDETFGVGTGPDQYYENYANFSNPKESDLAKFQKFNDLAGKDPEFEDFWNALAATRPDNIGQAGLHGAIQNQIDYNNYLAKKNGWIAGYNDPNAALSNKLQIALRALDDGMMSDIARHGSANKFYWKIIKKAKKLGYDVEPHSDALGKLSIPDEFK